jgi:hypothetical protein
LNIEPGHYWYEPAQGKDLIVIKVIHLSGREPWTCIDGYGANVLQLPGRIFRIRLEDYCYPPDGEKAE